MKKILKTVAVLVSSVTMLSAAAFGGMTASAATTYYSEGPLTYIIVNNKAIIVDCDSNTTSVTVPARLQGKLVTGIGNSAFSDCKKLTSLTLPNSIQDISNYAFINCIKLSNLRLPESLKTIGVSAFANCAQLRTITIPYQVNSVAAYAFNGCSSLRYITLDNPYTSFNPTGLSGSGNIYWQKPENNSYQDASTYCPGWTMYTYSLGDLNQDNDVDIVDAAKALQFYTNVIVSGQSPEYEMNYMYAIVDSDRDGEVTAADAQNVLKYYTQTSVAGNFDGTFREFMHSSYV